MTSRFVNYMFALLMTLGFSAISPVLAADLETKATDAVTAIIFEHQAEEFVTYRVSDKGFADVVFARNTPDLIYTTMLNKMLHHPDIAGVLAGKGGASCPLFH